MKLALFMSLVLATASSLRAEVVFSNLNTNPSASVGSGFTEFAQRFTTISAGTGLGLELNIVTQAGTPTYAVELWSADGAGTNTGSLLATIGGGSISSTDRTTVTSFSLNYGLAATTDYFIKLTASDANFGWVLGPSSSVALNSVLRYGVGNLNNESPSLAVGMQVVTVPEPGTCMLGGIAAGLTAAGVWRRTNAGNRRPVTASGLAR